MHEAGTRDQRVREADPATSGRKSSRERARDAGDRPVDGEQENCVEQRIEVVSVRRGACAALEFERVDRRGRQLSLSQRFRQPGARRLDAVLRIDQDVGVGDDHARHVRRRRLAVSRM